MSTALLSLCDPSATNTLLEQLHVATTPTAQCSSLRDRERKGKTRVRERKTDRKKNEGDDSYIVRQAAVLHGCTVL